MRYAPWSSSKWELILQNRDDRYVSELTTLGYISPLSTILYHAFWSEHCLYDASLLYNLFVNKDPWVYTLAQLQNFKSDLDLFSEGWLFNKEKGKKFLDTLRINLLGESHLADTLFSSYWIGNGINQHVLGVLSARVNAWIKLKNSPEDGLLEVLQSS